MAADEEDKFSEDGKLELQFDAVDQWFPGGLNFVQIRKLETDNAAIEQDHQDIDVYEMM